MGAGFRTHTSIASLSNRARYQSEVVSGNATRRQDKPLASLVGDKPLHVNANAGSQAVEYLLKEDLRRLEVPKPTIKRNLVCVMPDLHSTRRVTWSKRDCGITDTANLEPDARILDQAMK